MTKNQFVVALYLSIHHDVTGIEVDGMTRKQKNSNIS